MRKGNEYWESGGEEKGSHFNTYAMPQLVLDVLSYATLVLDGRILSDDQLSEEVCKGRSGTAEMKKDEGEGKLVK